MKTIKFNTFANTPQEASALGSKMHTQQSLSPKHNQNATNLNDLKREIQEALNFKRRSEKSQVKHKKYATQVSLMRSDISQASNQFPQPDLPLSLLELEVGFTEELLAMREDKITIMEQYNKQLEKRYKVQRQLGKLKKRSERKSQIDELLVFDNQSSSDKKKNGDQKQLLHDQKYDGEDQLLNEILRIEQSTKDLKRLLGECSPNVQNLEVFEQQNTGRSNPKILELQQLQKLREQRANWYRALADQLDDQTTGDFVYEMINENLRLLERNHQAYVYSKQSTRRMQPLSQLREIIKNEEEGKQNFFKDLRQFKQKAMLLKKENEQLKYNLNGRRF